MSNYTISSGSTVKNIMRKVIAHRNDYVANTLENVNKLEMISGLSIGSLISLFEEGYTLTPPKPSRF